MNYFTQLSIDLANQQDYLDRLFSVYPLAPDSIREIDTAIWENVKRDFHAHDNISMFRNLLKLPLFPVKDGYVPFFKKDPSAIERNPATVQRICGRVRELGLDRLFERCSEPKETNRQMGPLFRNWVRKGMLGVYPVCEEEFMAHTDNAILDGSDASLLSFARRHLGYTRKKGVDFIARFNRKYVIGEAKFISDEGGHQNAQFNDAMAVIMAQTNEKVIHIGIMDGVLYIKSARHKHRLITDNDVLVMSALVLREFLYSL